MAAVGLIAKEFERVLEVRAGKCSSGPNGADGLLELVEPGFDGAVFLDENVGRMHGFCLWSDCGAPAGVKSVTGVTGV
jgi:hypothetical protein